MKAIIPVAGRGKRLRPHTHTNPKAMLHVAGKPIIGHILDQLVELGIREVVMVVGYRGEMIKKYVTENYDFKTSFVNQEKLLGLGHAILSTKDVVIDGPGLIVLGDTIFEADLRPILDSTEALIGVRRVSDPRRFGIAEVEDDRIVRLVEKPDEPTSNLALVGIYYLPDMAPLYGALSDLLAADKRTKGEFQLTDALQVLLDRGTIMCTLEVDGWLDCGKPETLIATNRELLQDHIHHREILGSIIVDPVYIDDSATILDSIIGPNVSIGKDAHIERSILQDTIVNQGSTVCGAALDKSIIGEDAAFTGLLTRLNIGDTSEIEFTSM
ncbi:MAG: sugar phosphate nucleotidyltransferase [bacterium]